MKENKWWQSFLPELLTSLLILIVFFVCVDAYQYLTTEYWWIQDEINYTRSTVFLIILIIGLSFLPMKKWLAKWPKLGYLVLGLFIIGLIAHRKYARFYDELQQYPKIKSLSKDWGIPGSWVKITGRNFGEEWEPGQVYLGDAQMIIKKWGDKEVIFEITTEVEDGELELKILNIKEKIQKNSFAIKLIK